MSSKWRRIIRCFAVLLAFGLCALGCAGISHPNPNQVPGHYYFTAGIAQLLAAVVVVANYRANLPAVAIALSGSVIVALVPWVEQANRQTEGFEFEFNNSLDAMLYSFGALCAVALSAIGASLTSGKGQGSLSVSPAHESP